MPLLLKDSTVKSNITRCLDNICYIKAAHKRSERMQIKFPYMSLKLLSAGHLETQYVLNNIF